jgi:hypothetical protein
MGVIGEGVGGEVPGYSKVGSGDTSRVDIKSRVDCISPKWDGMGETRFGEGRMLIGGGGGGESSGEESPPCTSGLGVGD